MPTRISLFLGSVFRLFRRRPDPSRCPIAPPPEPPEPQPQPSGLAAIPAVAYGGSQAASGEEEGSEIESCTICLMGFARGDAVRILPNCGHTFHRDCIDEWLPLRSVRCPNCRHRTMETEAVEPERPARCINGNRRNDDPSSSPLILNFGNGCGHISSYL